MKRIAFLIAAATIALPLAAQAQMMQPAGPAPAGVNPSAPAAGDTVGPTGRVNESGPQQNSPGYYEEQGALPDRGMGRGAGETVDPSGRIDQSGPVENGQASPYHDHY